MKGGGEVIPGGTARTLRWERQRQMGYTQEIRVEMGGAREMLVQLECREYQQHCGMICDG